MAINRRYLSRIKAPLAPKFEAAEFENKVVQNLGVEPTKEIFT
jgi:hypothetical protein